MTLPLELTYTYLRDYSNKAGYPDYSSAEDKKQQTCCSIYALQNN